MKTFYLATVISMLLVCAHAEHDVISTIDDVVDEGAAHHSDMDICMEYHQEGCIPVGPSEGSCYASPFSARWFLVKVYGRYVRCDPSYGGWLVFVKRQDGSQNFMRTWTEYRDGFGDVTRELWLGNEMLHQITKQGVYKLRVEMEDWDGMKYWAEYNNFYVGPASDRYRLTVGGYNTESNAGDAMNDPSEGGRFAANGMYFSTIDVDNDNYQSGNCAEKGGWWHNRCKYAFPTGTYLKPGTESNEGIKWSTVNGNHHTFKAMEFKIRPLN